MQSPYPFNDLIYGAFGMVHDPDHFAFCCPGVYFAFGGDLVKIGYTSQPNSRLRCLRTPGGVKASVIIFVPQALFNEPYQDYEQTLHDRFAEDRVIGEWFRPSDEILRLAASYEDDACALMAGYREWLAIQLASLAS